MSKQPFLRACKYSLHAARRRAVREFGPQGWADMYKTSKAESGYRFQVGVVDDLMFFVEGESGVSFDDAFNAVTL